MGKKARDAEKVELATAHMVSRYRTAAEREEKEIGSRDRIDRLLREIWREIEGLPPLEMRGIVEYIQTDKSINSIGGLDDAIEKKIVETQRKNMNSPQKERFILAIKSRMNHLEGKKSPIMPIGAKIKLNFLKGEVVDISGPNVRIKWEDGTADWVHGGTAHKYYGR